MAFSFNGSSYLTTPTLNHGIGTGDFTFASWVFVTSVSAFDRPVWQNSGSGIVLYACSDTSSNVTIEVIGGARTQVGTAITANAWQHLAVRRSGTTITAFINGVAAGTTVTSAVGLSNAAQILGRSAVSGMQLLSGSRMAEAALWAAAMSVGEIGGLAKYWTPPEVRTSGLRLYMPMRRERVDRWSFGGAATVTGTESYTTHPPMVETLFGQTGDVGAGGGGGGGSGPVGVLGRVGIDIGVGIGFGG